MYKAGRKLESFPHSFLAVFSLVSNTTNFFIDSLNRLVFLKGLHIARFFHTVALYANISDDPRSEYNWCKSGCSECQWSWGSGGVLKPQQRF